MAEGVGGAGEGIEGQTPECLNLGIIWTHCTIGKSKNILKNKYRQIFCPVHIMKKTDNIILYSPTSAENVGTSASR